MPIWAVNLLVGVALTVASTLLQQTINANKPQTQSQQPSGLRTQYTTGDVEPKSFAVGTIGLAGKLEYENSWGDVDGTPRAYLTRVLSFGDIPVHDFEYLYVNLMRTTKVSTGAVDQGYPVPEYVDAGLDHLWWRWHDGSQTTADDYLVAKFGSDEVYTWTSSHIGRGIPYVVLTALWNRVLWGGKFPDFMLQIRGIKLYDPRKDTTAGGSGSHLADDPSTWEWSDNPVVFIYNVARLGIRWNGEWMWGRRTALSASRFPHTEWAAAMDACDTLVDLVEGGSEKQFRIGREVRVSERPIDVINKMLSACNGQMSSYDGKYHILVGEPESPILTFTDADVLETEAIDLDPFPQFERIVNGATGTYLEPLQGWTEKDSDPYYRPDLEVKDRSQRLADKLGFQEVFSGTQVQRLLKSKVLDARRFKVHIIYLPPRFKIAAPLKTIAWTSSRNQYSGKWFQVRSRARRPDGVMMLSIREVDPTDHSWDPESDEQTITFTPVVSQLPAPQPMTGDSVAPYIFVDANGRTRRPGIEIGFTAFLVDIRSVRVQVRLAGVSGIVFDGEVPYDPTDVPPVSRAVTWAGCLPNTAYEVRLLYVPFSGRETQWGSWLSVTTPDVGLTGDDLADDTIVINNLAREVRSGIEGMLLPVPMSVAAQLAALREDFDLFAARVLDLAVNFDRRTTVLEARANTTAASITEDRIVMANDREAAAMGVDIYRAQVDTSLAIVGTSISAVASDLAAETALRIALASETASSFAAVDLTLGTHTTDIESNASAILSVTSKLDLTELTSGIAFKTEATPTDGSARVAIYIKVGSTPVAAHYLDAVPKSGGGYKGRTVVIGDEFWMLKTDGDYASSPFYVVGATVRIRDVQIESLTSFDGESIVLDGEDGDFSFGAAS